MKYKRQVLQITILCVIMYLLSLVLMFLIQEQLLFKPVKLPPDYSFNLNSEFEEHWTTINNLKIHSLYFKKERPKGIILYFHGNGCNVSSCANIAENLLSYTDYNVWIFDYPGYGKSEGKIINEKQLHHIAKSIYNKVEKLNFENIVIYGRSLGTGIATKLATNNKASALILETPYLSIKELALKKYPFVPSKLLKYSLRTDQWITNVKSDILIIHGTHDELIPTHHSIKLSNLTDNETLVIIENGGHDDLSKYKTYWESINLFLSSIKN